MDLESTSNHDSSGKSARPSATREMPSAYARGTRDSKQRRRELSSASLTERPLTTDPVSEDVLPGIPSRNADLQSVSHRRASSKRHKSVELSKAQLPRPTSAGEANVGESRRSQARLRTRTMDDPYKEAPLSDLNYRSRQQTGSAEDDSQSEERKDDQDDGPTSVSQDTSNQQSDMVGRRAGRSLVSHTELPPWAEEIRQPVLAPPSASFMEHLMRRTRGQMQGNLLYRRDPSHDWIEAYCSLSAHSASLLRESSRGKVTEHKIIPDLRGCRVKSSYDARARAPILQLRVKSQPHVYHLCPVDLSEFNTWFAALLCWQAVRSSRSLYADSDEAQLTPITAPPPNEKSKSRDDRPVEKEPTIVKVGKLKFWNRDDTVWPATGESLFHDANDMEIESSNWSTVSCILRESGELKILTTTDIKVVATIWLSRLSRCAVQRLCPSVLDEEHSFAIYPQYARAAEGSSRLRPLYLCCESRELFETWFVLMRAFTLPEIYGPATSKDADSLRSPEMLPGLSQGTASQVFRVERSLHLLVGEYRDKRASRHPSLEAGADIRPAYNMKPAGSDCFVQILVDGKVSAKTRPRHGAGETQWYQPLEILDLPPTVSFITVQIRQIRKTRGRTDERTLQHSKTPQKSSQEDDNQTENTTIGELIIPFSEPTDSGNAIRRWPIMDETGQTSGDLLLQMQLDRDVILLDQEYSVLSELLHDFSSDLTLQIADAIPPEKLSVMSDHLLNIFQASGAANDWLQSLAEEEIDGIRRSGPTGRLRMNGRLQSSASRESLAPYGPSFDREGLVRDITKATAAEANLLFRGNTLLSKALDGHMQRLGREYLEETLGAKMREISNLDQDIEVDPSKISATASPQYNWHRLIEFVKEVWTLIRSSASRCPTELRVIFRHIRACADEKYGGRLKNIPFASVSGFLFLRFFCPAILNPFVFGLVHDFPRPRAHRGFTLIAKSLQGLANQTTFGAKEPWLEPMNNFLNEQRAQLRQFIDDICTIPPAAQPSSGPSPYSTALATFSRLAPANKEGTLSLPYLIDSSRSFAAIVDQWLACFVYNPANRPLDRDLLQFHNVCLRLRQRTQDLFKRAERFEKRSSSLIEESGVIAARMESHPAEFWVGFPEVTKTRLKSTDEAIVESKVAADASPAPAAAAPVAAAAAATTTTTTASIQIQSNKTPQRPSTAGGAIQEPRRGVSRRFRSRSRSRTSSPKRGTDNGRASPVVEDDMEASERRAARKDKSKSKGLFGRKKRPET